MSFQDKHCKCRLAYARTDSGRVGDTTKCTTWLAGSWKVAIPSNENRTAASSLSRCPHESKALILHNRYSLRRRRLLRKSKSSSSYSKIAIQTACSLYDVVSMPSSLAAINLDRSRPLTRHMSQPLKKQCRLGMLSGRQTFLSSLQRDQLGIGKGNGGGQVLVDAPLSLLSTDAKYNSELETYCSVDSVCDVFPKEVGKRLCDVLEAGAHLQPRSAMSVKRASISPQQWRPARERCRR